MAGKEASVSPEFKLLVRVFLTVFVVGLAVRIMLPFFFDDLTVGQIGAMDALDGILSVVLGGLIGLIGGKSL